MQEKSFMQLSTLLGVGMMPELLVPFTKHWLSSYQPDTTLFPTQHFHRVRVDALGKYVPRSQRALHYQTTQMSSTVSSPSTVNFSHSDSQRSGECAHCRARLDASEFH